MTKAPLNKTFRLLASLKVAIPLLVVLVVVTIVGSLFPTPDFFATRWYLALLGLLAALWAEKFDQMAAVTNFVITPLSFLSGTFYSIEQLPESIHAVALFNPFFYMIDGIRFGFIGHADAECQA